MVFSIIKPVVTQTTNSGFRELFDTFRQNQFTGAVDIAFAAEESLQLILGYGNVVEATLRKHGQREALSHSILIEFLARLPEAEVSAREFLPSLVVPARIMSALEPATTLEVRSSGIPQLLSEWGRFTDLSLVHMRWQDAEALLVLPGGGGPPCEAIFIRSEMIRTAPEVMDTIKARLQPECFVSRWSNDPPGDLWSLLQSRLAFGDYVGHVLTRYEQFTGRALVNMAARDVAALAARSQWNIRMSGAQMTDHAVYATADEAFEAYRAIMTTIMQHIISVVGRKLMDTILIDSAFDLTAPQRNDLARFGLLPESVQTHMHKAEPLNA